MTNRREFLESGFKSGMAILLSGSGIPSYMTGPGTGRVLENKTDGADLFSLCDRLLASWMDRLLELQITGHGMGDAYGGILCPACSVVHGRCGDAILPMLYLAKHTGSAKYLTSARLLYTWMEANVSLPDGSWVNEVSVSDWNGISVFTVLTLAESLIHFGDLLDAETRTVWKKRLREGIDFVYREFTVHTGNINYPVTATYALSLCAKFFNEPKYLDKAKQLAGGLKAYFTPNDRFLFGEGRPAREPSEHGCYSVDLGYNVEESLPALLMYAQLAKDEEMLALVKASLDTHLQFMLPDGAWDNSWGTRNFKWTYWGSRTSDGCQPLAFFSGQDPRFYTAALANARLLEACTHEGLLHGGPHYQVQGVRPCAHHTFGHSKALAVLMAGRDRVVPPVAARTPLPREQAYGIKFFRDIRTWLVAEEGWRATLTAYDREYEMPSGHASGGALSMLWHPTAGPVLCGSMTVYQLTEAANMQRDKADPPMALTPRFEIREKGAYYTDVHDLAATVSASQNGHGVTLHSRALLLDGKQRAPSGERVQSHIRYTFSQKKVDIRAGLSGTAKASYMLPVIASAAEQVTILSDRIIEIRKPDASIRVESDIPFQKISDIKERIFNFVPGLAAIPLQFEGTEINISIRIV